MKEDKLKAFIDIEKEAFNDEAPSDAVWKGIKKGLDSDEESAKGAPYKLWAIAATVTLLLVSGLFFLLKDGTGDLPDENLSAIEISDNPLQSLGEDMMEVDHYYSIQVNQRLERLKAYEVDEELMEEMSELTAEFEGLKEEMGESMNDAFIVEAMIENYRLRLSLLEDLLKALEPQSDENHSDEQHDL